MSVINVTNARQSLYRLIEDVNTNCEPIIIINNKGKNAVLISEDDWNAIQETNYINSIPGLADQIVESGNTPLEECIPEDEVQW